MFNTLSIMFLGFISLLFFIFSVAAFNNINDISKSPTIIRNGWLMILCISTAILVSCLSLLMCEFYSEGCNLENLSNKAFKYLFLALSLFLVIVSSMIISEYNTTDVSTYETSGSNNKNYAIGILLVGLLILIVFLLPFAKELYDTYSGTKK